MNRLLKERMSTFTGEKGAEETGLWEMNRYKYIECSKMLLKWENRPYNYEKVWYNMPINGII